MNITSLIRNWTESLTFLRWETAKLLILVTLNTFVRSLRLMIKHFWWLIASILILTALGSIVPQKLATPLLLSTEMLLFFCFFLGARPSIENKDFNYFNKYIGFKPKYHGLGIFMLGLWYLPYILSPLLWFISPILGGIIDFFVQPTLLYASFFFLDSDLSARDFFPSVKRGFTLLVNFLPGVMVLNSTLGLVSLMISTIVVLCGFIFSSEVLNSLSPILTNTFSLVIVKGLSLIVTGLSISLTSTLYTKIKHSHYSLFFERK